jgi:hypothetical protein
MTVQSQSKFPKYHIRVCNGYQVSMPEYFVGFFSLFIQMLGLCFETAGNVYTYKSLMCR